MNLDSLFPLTIFFTKVLLQHATYENLLNYSGCFLTARLSTKAFTWITFTITDDTRFSILDVFINNLVNLNSISESSFLAERGLKQF